MLTLWLGLFALIVVHEAGHAAAAQAFGLHWKPTLVRLRRVPIAPAIAVHQPEGGFTPGVALTLALSGPAASLVATVALWRVEPTLAFLSADFGIVSLIPIRRQDGWHALQAVKAIVSAQLARQT